MNSLALSQEPLRVLIVDDTPDLRDLVAMALERTGEFRVVAQAGDGREGLEAAQTHDPDLVILDIAMPVMDGLQALPLIRQECPSAIVVMLSAFGDSSGMPQRAMAMGADGYLHKDGRIQALPEQILVIVRAVGSARDARRAREARA